MVAAGIRAYTVPLQRMARLPRHSPFRRHATSDCLRRYPTAPPIHAAIARLSVATPLTAIYTTGPAQKLRIQGRRGNRGVTTAAAVGKQASGDGSGSGGDCPPEYFYRMSQFCRKCGGSMDVGLEDTTWRHICNSCGYIDYFNPKMVVGCVIEHDGKVLLCRRGIEPCKGKWTLPAGFMELNESTADGARRETREEVMAEVVIQAPYFHLDIPVIGQSYVLFRSTLAPPFTFACGPETLEVGLFDPKDIPFEELAFSSISITLQHYLEDMQSGKYRLHHAEIEKLPGTAPNDPNSFRLVNHMSFQVCQ